MNTHLVAENSRRTFQIATLCCALLLQACEWFESAEFQEQNPFQREPLELHTAHAPRVSLDGAGFASLIYYEQVSRGTIVTTFDTKRSSALVQRHNLMAGTLEVATLAEERSGPGSETTTMLASDAAGTATFFTFSGSRRCRLSAVQSWDCEARVGEHVAAESDGAGRILVLIRGTGNSANARLLTPGAGWGADHLVFVNRTQPTSSFSDRDERRSLAFWNGGIGFAASADSGRNVLVARYLRDSDTWESPQVLGATEDVVSEGGGILPVLALARNAPNSAAVVAWPGVGGELHFSRYVPGSGWLTAQPIPQTQDPNHLVGLDMEMSDNGDVLLVGIGARSGSIRSLRHRNGTWEAPQTIGTLRDVATRPRVVMDGAGNGIAVWYDIAPSLGMLPANAPRLFLNRFDAARGWQGAEQIGVGAVPYVGSTDTGTSIDSASTEDVDVFDVDMDASGRAMVAWIGQPNASSFPSTSRLRTFVTGLFTLSATPSLSVPRNGGNSVASVAIARNGLAIPVELEVLDCPARVICSLGRTQLPGDVSATTLTFFTTSEAAAVAGDYDVRIRATGGAQSSQTVVRLTLAGGDPPLSDITLTVNVTGNGRVTSTPAGLDCLGPLVCSATFARNQSVALNAIPGSGQAFTGFGGDADCSDGSLVLSANTSCTAPFIPQTGQWAIQGTALNITAATTPAFVTSPEIEIDNSGRSVAAFVENTDVIVRRFENGAWRTLGTTPSTLVAQAVSLTIDSTGAPVVAWEQYEAASGDARRNVFAARWDETSGTWMTLGGGPVDLVLADDSYAPSIRTRSNDIALAWAESMPNGGSRAVVRIWNGSTWSHAGNTEGPAAVTLTQIYGTRLAVGPGNELAVAWAEDLQTRVAELVGGAWTATATPPLPAANGGAAYMLDIAYSAAEGLLFVAQQNNGAVFSVRRWRNGAWSDLGTPRGADMGGGPRVFGLAFSHGRTGSTPLLAYSRRNNAGSVHEFIVERVNGADWTRIGNAIAPIDRNNRPGLELYVATADGASPRVATQVISSLPNSGSRDDSLNVYRFQ